MTSSKPPARARTTTIHFYTTCWNDEFILPHFLAHHRALFDRMVVVDDGSTDQSLKLMRKEANVEARSRERHPSQSYIWLNMQVYNEIWKESRGKADWVVVGNLDEFTYCRDLRGYLGECAHKGVTVVPVLGFNMVSRLPLAPGQQLMRTIQDGAPSEGLCRFAIFNPDAINEIGYLAGRHKCNPVGEIVIPDRDRVLNLHYKRVGLENTFVRTQAQNRQRSDFDRRLGLGFQYDWAWGPFMEQWTKLEADCLNVFEWYKLNRPYPGQVWWRRSGAHAFASVTV